MLYRLTAQAHGATGLPDPLHIPRPGEDVAPEPAKSIPFGPQLAEHIRKRKAGEVDP